MQCYCGLEIFVCVTNNDIVKHDTTNINAQMCNLSSSIFACAGGGQIPTMTITLTLLPRYMILAKCLYSSGLSKDTRSMHRSLKKI